ncbi:hypothetical protein ABPG72_016720 [Tetrahymena utriculariae]
MDKSRQQLIQLCQSFQLLFQKLKDNRKHKLEIQKSNDHLRQIITSENEKRIQTQEILDQEKDQLQKQLKQVQEILEAYQSNNVQIISAINQSANQQKVLIEQKKNLEERLKEKESTIHDKLQQQSFLKEEMNILCRQMTLINGSDKDLESAIQSQVDNLEAQKNKLNEQLQKIKENDDFQSQLNQEKDKSEMNYKSIQKELAQTIKQNAAVQQKIKDCSKIFEKLSSQLTSKMERLNTQYKHNDQLNQQIKKLENLKVSQQNYQQAGQYQHQQSQISKNLSPNSRIRLSKQRQAQQAELNISEEQRNRVNDYRIQLNQQLNYYKNQIENYDAMINQLQQDIENLQSQFEQFSFIPQDQLIQLFQQHFLAQNENQQQKFYSEQDQNHLQQGNYESFNPNRINDLVSDDFQNRNDHLSSQVVTSQQNNYSDGIFQQENDQEEEEDVL